MTMQDRETKRPSRCAERESPGDRCDVIAPVPGQIDVKAVPLCGTSGVSCPGVTPVRGAWPAGGGGRTCPPSAGLRRFRRLCLALALWLGGVGALRAEDPGKELWPEVDLWLRLSPEWRLSMFVPISKNIETAYREGNLILQADYAWGRTTLLSAIRLVDDNRAQKMNALLARAGYLGGMSLDDRGDAYKERTLLLELHARNPLKGRLLLSHRVRADLRWLGDDLEFSTRLRYRAMLEKELDAGSTSVVPYVNGEAYYDTRYETVNRIRLIGGASVAWEPRFALEGNITYQHDSRSSVTNLLALNVILHLFFDAGGDP